MEADGNSATLELEIILNRRLPTEKELAECVSGLAALNATKIGLECELSEEMTSQLCTSDREILAHLNSEIRRLKLENNRVFGQRLDFERQKCELENYLNNNLMKQRNELKDKIRFISPESAERRVNSLVTQLEETRHSRAIISSTKSKR